MKTSIVRKNNNKYLTSASLSKSLDLVESLNDFSKVNLKAEWKIWSKCFGKVFVINGVSSVGKTTLASYLSKFGFNKISLDDIYDQLFFDALYNIIPDEISYAQKALITQDDIKKIFEDCKVNKSKYYEWQIHIIDILKISIIPIRENHSTPHLLNCDGNMTL